MISAKHFLFGGICAFVLAVVYFLTLPDGKLHIVFCDVGQGDAAYIRTPSGADMLIDGGPNDKVLTCLGNHMPFYDRTIDVVALSHPQKDHMQGLLAVVERYRVKSFIMSEIGNDTEGYRKLIQLLSKHNIHIRYMYKGDKMILGAGEITVLWPAAEKVASFRSAAGRLAGNSVLPVVLGAQSNVDINDFSYYFHMRYGSFDALFTGDGDSRIQPDIMEASVLPDVELLKFPHHGSKTGSLPKFLDAIKPELAVISVGKNSYGHPSGEAIKLLSDRAITLLRTDQEGDIEVVSNGKEWWVE